MAIHTFGEYLDFYPHLHALVADGLFDCEGKFHLMRAGELGDKTDAQLAGNHAELEQLFRARVIAFLVEAGLLPLDRAHQNRCYTRDMKNRRGCRMELSGLRS